MLGLLSVFYVFPPVLGALGRVYAPELAGTDQADTIVLRLPALVFDGWPGQALSALVAAGECLEERAQVGELVARAALERASLAADVHQEPLVRALEPPQQDLQPLAVGAEPDDHELRPGSAREDARPGGEEQVDALRDDQLADEDDARPLGLG